MTRHHGHDQCAMSETCEGKEADHGLMCADHRAEDRENTRMFGDDVDPASRPPLPLRVVREEVVR